MPDKYDSSETAQSEHSDEELWKADRKLSRDGTRWLDERSKGFQQDRVLSTDPDGVRPRFGITPTCCSNLSDDGHWNRRPTEDPFCDVAHDETLGEGSAVCSKYDDVEVARPIQNRS